MANEIKNYFLAPSWDYPPNGPIALGNIVEAPDEIVPPLYAHTPTDTDPPVIASSKYGVDWSRAKSNEGSFGVWAKFLQFLGLGVDVGANSTSLTETIYHFERIDTEESFPDEDAIRKRMASPTVKTYLEKSAFRSDVYMIVGIKKVTGVMMKAITGKEGGTTLDITLDGAVVVGAPVSAGPRANYKSTKSDGLSFEKSTDFVFAFRLRRVKISKNGKVEQGNYSKGALLGDEIDEAPAVSETFTVLGLEDQDASAENFGLEAEEREQEVVMDGEERVQVTGLK